jgi:hypothetical protein
MDSDFSKEGVDSIWGEAVRNAVVDRSGGL